MFDVGFSELMMIAVVALVVIGPERLPKVARTLGHLIGRLQRYVNDVKADINREIELDELKKFKHEFDQAAQSVEAGVRSELSSTEATLNSIAEDFASEATPSEGALAGAGLAPNPPTDAAGAPPAPELPPDSAAPGGDAASSLGSSGRKAAA